MSATCFNTLFELPAHLLAWPGLNSFRGNLEPFLVDDKHVPKKDFPRSLILDGQIMCYGWIEIEIESKSKSKIVSEETSAGLFRFDFQF